MNTVLEATESTTYAPVESEHISAEEYLGLKSNGFRNVKRVRIAAAKLGDAGFGGFIVQYDYPVMKNK